MILPYFRSQWKLKAERFMSYGKLRDIAINFYLAELSLHRAGVTPSFPADIQGIDKEQLQRELESLDQSAFPRLPESRSTLFVETIEYQGEGTFSFRLFSVREASERLLELLVDMLREVRRIERQSDEMFDFLAIARPRDILLYGSPQFCDVSKFRREIIMVRPIDLVTHIRLDVGAYHLFNKADMRIEFTGVWGQTTIEWRHAGWKPQSWNPNAEELTFLPSMNQATSRQMNTFYWNVMGVDNPSFEEVFCQFIREKSPTIVVLTETWVKSSVAHVLFPKLQTGMKLLSTDGTDGNGGVCLLFDPNFVSVVPIPGAYSQFHCILIDKRALPL